MSHSHAENLLRAADFANHLRLPFNRMITVHWQAAGVPLECMAKATGRFLDLATKALARKGQATSWIWVHENAGGSKKGGHAHILLHVPAALVPVLTSLQKRWLRTITGTPYRARIIKSEPIGGRLGLERGNPDLHSLNLDAALAYILKGVAPDAGARLGLPRLEAGGLIIGKRCATSQNIGPKARKTSFSRSTPE